MIPHFRRIAAYNWQHEHRAACTMGALRNEYLSVCPWNWDEDHCMDAPESLPAGNIRKNERGVHLVRMVRREPVIG